MKGVARIMAIALAWPAAGVSLPAAAAEPQVVPGAAVELPPMLVEESVSSVPWLYVNAGGTEFLSRCSAGTTRDLAEAWLAKLQLVRALVPEEFLARMDVPSVFVLYSQDLKQTISEEIQRELQGKSPGDSRKRPGLGSSGERVNIAPSMRLSDRDMHASIAYIDEMLFDAAALSVAPGHVRFLLQRRVPELPAWAMEGVERAYAAADFVLDPITLGPVVWQNRGESEDLAADPNRPRALLPAVELFAGEVARAMENRHPRRMEIRTATQELFFRWATTTGAATRAAYWKFVARAAEGPVTEEMFEALFGFDYAELRDRLSDHLPKAAVALTWLRPGPQPALPEFEVQKATPNEIARVRGEWERLAIGHVQRRLPQVREPYIAQARRTLRRAYDAGDRDPRLLATMGLCEVDAGNDPGARQFLEPAVAGGVVRPRAYHELARIRFSELREGAPETKVFSFTEVAPVIDPLRRALKQAPPLSETYVLLAEAWARCEVSPTAEEFAELEHGARLFARRPTIVFPLAQALARHGRRTEAAAALEGCAGYPADDTTRAGMARLRAELATLVQATADEGTASRP